MSVTTRLEPRVVRAGEMVKDGSLWHLYAVALWQAGQPSEAAVAASQALQLAHALLFPLLPGAAAASGAAVPGRQ